MAHIEDSGGGGDARRDLYSAATRPPPTHVGYPGAEAKPRALRPVSGVMQH